MARRQGDKQKKYLHLLVCLPAYVVRRDKNHPQITQITQVLGSLICVICGFIHDFDIALESFLPRFYAAFRWLSFAPAMIHMSLRMEQIEKRCACGRCVSGG